MRWRFTTHKLFPTYRTVRADSNPETMVADRVRDLFKEAETNSMACLVTYKDKYDTIYMFVQSVAAEKAEGITADVTTLAKYEPSYWEIRNDRKYVEPPMGFEHYEVRYRCLNEQTLCFEAPQARGIFDDIKILAKIQPDYAAKLKVQNTSDTFNSILAGLMGKGFAKKSINKGRYGRGWSAVLEYDKLTVTIEEKED